jgi:hypothetical protein
MRALFWLRRSSTASLRAAAMLRMALMRGLRA